MFVIVTTNDLNGKVTYRTDSFGSQTESIFKAKVYRSYDNCLGIIQNQDETIAGHTRSVMPLPSFQRFMCSIEELADL